MFVMVGTSHGRSVVDVRATAQKHAGLLHKCFQDMFFHDVTQWHTYGA